MTKLFLSILLFLHFSSRGQIATIIPSKTAVLKDSMTNCIYVLDTSHKYITAYNYKGDSLWTSYTIVSAFDIRHTNIKPVEIRLMKFGNISDAFTAVEKSKDEKVIWISHDKCSGYIDLKTGKYHVYGCD